MKRDKEKHRQQLHNLLGDEKTQLLVARLLQICKSYEL